MLTRGPNRNKSSISKAEGGGRKAELEAPSIASRERERPEEFGFRLTPMLARKMCGTGFASVAFVAIRHWQSQRHTPTKKPRPEGHG
jgi:hypothetical protein